MKYEINFDKNMAAEFYAELISSVNFARIAKMHNWFDQADGYVNAFRKTSNCSGGLAQTQKSRQEALKSVMLRSTRTERGTLSYAMAGLTSRCSWT